VNEIIEERPAPVPLLEPRGGVPPVIDTDAALDAAIAALAAGSGPVAVDAERASGYRYGQRAYLIQLRREPAGIVLIDPIAFDNLDALSAVLSDSEWILHAASQDLPSLRTIGMQPTRLFDTELAARLAGFERVGLATMVEVLLGQQLAKEHSAADWSRRPLPEPWLRYAALDVEILLELRDALEAELTRQGKLEWAHEEFDAVLHAEPPAPRADPWRRTSGMHRVRTRRQLAIVRALWEARDTIAQQRDTAPGRVLPDIAIIGAAITSPTEVTQLARVPGWGGRSTRRLVAELWPTIAATYALAESDLPRPAAAGDGPPPPNRWPDRDPVAAARLARARVALAELGKTHNMPVENLLTPDLVRRLAWSPPATDLAGVSAYLRDGGARNWQIELTAAPLSAAMVPASPQLAPVADRAARDALLRGELGGLEAAPGWPHDDTAPAMGFLDSGGLVVLIIDDEGRIAGECGIKTAPGPDGVVEIGYGLAAPSRGKGLGSAAVAALVAWLAARPDVRVIEAEVHVGNVASWRVLERLGFTATGAEVRGYRRYALEVTG
jgi:ribonuclease D